MRKRQADSLNKRENSTSGLRELSPDIFSGIGAGNVNAIINNPNRIDH